uniref:Uncharacterized protein n=1 Tax=Knipowitschia caucasica TaxID=637954 RepID=A0AAV2JQ40_KNICA
MAPPQCSTELKRTLAGRHARLTSPDLYPQLHIGASAKSQKSQLDHSQSHAIAPRYSTYPFHWTTCSPPVRNLVNALASLRRHRRIVRQLVGRHVIRIPEKIVKAIVRRLLHSSSASTAPLIPKRRHPASLPGKIPILTTRQALCRPSSLQLALRGAAAAGPTRQLKALLVG